MGGDPRFLGEFEQMVLLGILQQDERAFALEVRREIEESAGRSVSRGAFYTTIDRLERKGLVTWDEAVPPGPRSDVPLRRYRVTATGREALRTSRHAMDALWQGLDHLLDRA